MIDKLKDSELVLILKILLCGYFIFLAIGTIVCLVSIIFEDTENIQLADGFTISSYQVILDVSENNVVDVTELIKVDYQEENHTTFYEYVPEWNEYTGKDGKTIERKSKIDSYKAVGEPYTVDTDKKKTRITIGNVNKPNPLGEKTYTIKYTYDMGEDPFENIDEFIFHAFGDYWKVEIQNASIQINMPKSIEGYPINFFTDKYRENNVTDIMNYEIDGKTLYAEFNQEKYEEKQREEYCKKKENCYLSKSSIETLNNSLTVDIELPEGYFENGNWNYGVGSLFLCIAIFSLTFLNFFRWSKYGKDYPKKIKTSEFYPPENYSSAEIGFIYGKSNNKKLAVSLMIQLASKGYIKIDELNDEKKNIQITNMVIKPKNEILISPFVSKRIIKVEKKKEIDNSLTNDEINVMNQLFQNTNTKEITTNIDSFLKVKDSLVEKGYLIILDDNEEKRQKEYEEKNIKYELKLAQIIKEKENYKKKMRELPTLTTLEELVYHELFYEKDVILLRDNKTFYYVFKEMEDFLKAKLKDMIDDRFATLKMIQSIFMPILVFLLYLIAIDFINDLSPSWNIFYTIAFPCIFINIFLTMIMKRKTRYGESIVPRVRGFKEYLLKVDQERLEELIKQNPNYFYEILPYAYTLNIFKKWVGKLEKIPTPLNDMGSFPFTDYEAYQRIYHNIYYLEPFKLSTSNEEEEIEFLDIPQ